VAVGEHLGYLFTGLWSALAGVALIQSDLLHPLFGIAGLVLASLFVLGSLEFVGPFEPQAGSRPARWCRWPMSAGPCGCWRLVSVC
jgi:membrane-bound ClpP family serine protease